MTDDCGGPGHTHRLPRALLLTLIIICAGLVVSIVLVSVQAVRADKQARETDHRLRALEGFIAERGEMRDQQYETLDQRITAKLCAVLEALPAGGVLDEVRAENGCGPGIPFDQLPADVQNQLRPQESAPSTANSGAATPGPFVQPAEPTSAPAPTPAPSTATGPPTVPTAAPSSTAAATTSAPPLVNLGPITQPLCSALGNCV